MEQNGIYIFSIYILKNTVKQGKTKDTNGENLYIHQNLHNEIEKVKNKQKVLSQRDLKKKPRKEGARAWSQTEPASHRRSLGCDGVNESPPSDLPLQWREKQEIKSLPTRRCVLETQPSETKADLQRGQVKLR